jgi:protein-S-isoprenylcysteine O-methyltransferase Ste14
VRTYVAIAIVIVVYAVAFRIPLRRRRTVEQRSAQSWVGVIVVGIGFASLYVGRPRLNQLMFFAGGWPADPAIVAGLASTCVITGAVFIVWSQRTLGKQWSFSARVVEGHQLVTHGPYAIVRNPIYSSLALLLLGLGLTFSTPVRVAVGLALYLAGTVMRVRAEEELMAGTFGEEWEAYRRRVPALIPWL